MKQNIIFTVTNMELPNGLVTSVRNLADAMISRGYRVQIFVLNYASPEFSKRYEVFYLNKFIKYTSDMIDFDNSKLVLKPIRIFLKHTLEPIVKFLIRRKIKSFDSEDTVIIGSSLEAFNYLASKANLDRFSRIIQMHMSYEGLTEGNFKALEQSISYADKGTVLSEYDGLKLSEKYSFKFIKIPNVVDMGIEHNPYKLNNRNFIYAGRLAEEKQVHHIVSAFKGLNKQDWKLKIYGDGPLRDEIKNLIKDEEAIIYGGQAYDMHKIYREAGINVISSLIEGLPMTIVESGQFGVPSIAYNVSSGIEEAVDGAGILINDKNVDNLRAAMQKMIDNNDFRYACSENAFMKCLSYKSNFVLKMWEEVF